MPGTAAHPITVAPAGVRVRAEAQGRVIMDSANAIALREANYPVVYYAPRDEMRMEWLEKSATVTHCPFKGACSYWHVTLPDGSRIDDAVWAYEDPLDDMAAIKGHFAVYPSKLTLTTA